MRLVIDMQGAQSTGSRNRGIGRYTLSLVKELVSLRKDDDIIILLNGRFPETVDVLRHEFDGMLESSAIHVWMPPSSCRGLEKANDPRRYGAEAIYEGYISSLKPDVVLTTSLFEGFIDDTVTSIGRFTKNFKTATILYDLIPLIHRHPYLDNPDLARWYHSKIDHLRRADMLLSISDSSGKEAVDYLGIPEAKIVNIGTACGSEFHPRDISHEELTRVKTRYGINRPFIMYTGGIDHRKNIEGLIRAFSEVRADLRGGYQLAIVCAASEFDKARLHNLALKMGLAHDDIVLTGFVSEQDLIVFYNSCYLFVFPSLHEGFGLPALEAMACGRPTIGSSNSSLPEVIGWSEAQFDATDDRAIANIITHVLTDEHFRQALISHAYSQASKFSWTKTADAAWVAMRKLAKQSHSKSRVGFSRFRPKMAIVSPVTGAKSGIAYYVGELMPKLSQYYDIDVVVEQVEDVVDEWVLSSSKVRSVDWFRENHSRYDRIVYHFGNSHYHGHMFRLLDDIPGIVVLHDFFLSGIVAQLDLTEKYPGFWDRTLKGDHGWLAVQERAKADNPDEVVWAYPCCGGVIRAAKSVIAHSAHSVDLAKLWYGDEAAEKFQIIPHLRTPYRYSNETERAQVRLRAREKLGLKAGDFIVCSFGHMGPTKLNDRLADAWLSSKIARQRDCRLIFAGQNAGGTYGQAMLQKAAMTKNIYITEYLDTDAYRTWLEAADVAVQLRTNSRGETSGAVLDCWNYGLPLIVNSHGSLSNLADEAVLKIPDDFSDDELIGAIMTLKQNSDMRLNLSENSRLQIRDVHSPDVCALKYYEKIEEAYSIPTSGFDCVTKAVDLMLVDDGDSLLAISDAAAKNFKPEFRRPQILVDVTVLAFSDSKTGIQQVVKNVLNGLISDPPVGFDVCPIYGRPHEDVYRYANKFTCNTLGINATNFDDDVVEAWNGDIFLALDLRMGAIRAQMASLLEMQRRGVTTYAVVYDLLPILLPDAFPAGTSHDYDLWLNAIRQFDGALCISRSVADDLAKWLKANFSPDKKSAFNVYVFQLGARLDKSDVVYENSNRVTKVSNDNHDVPTFLMVGTLEPRKGHKLVLDAFELLWASGKQVRLVIAGKEGWLVDDLASYIQSHPENGHRLQWLRGATDEQIDVLYRDSSALIAASLMEGFGLPLVEGASRGLPIIARDIPVFREVAGDSAEYFSRTADADYLSKFLDEWLSRFRDNAHVKSSGLRWLTWQGSSEQVKSILASAVEPEYVCVPIEGYFYWGNDKRLKNSVGKKSGFSIASDGRTGVLLYGPYISLKSGSYNIIVEGYAEKLTGVEKIEAAFGSGEVCILSKSLLPASGACRYTLRAELEQDVNDFEVRILVDQESEISIHSLQIVGS